MFKHNSKMPIHVARTAAIAKMQAMLGIPDAKGNKPAHIDKIISSVDTEWYSAGGKYPPLEAGVALLDTRDVYHLDAATATDFDYIKMITVVHFRFNESCHIKNKAPWLGDCYNRADKFQYGATEYISRDQIQPAFEKLLRVPDDRNPGKLRELHVITHGGDNHDFNVIADFAKPKFVFKAAIPMETEDLQSMSKHAIHTIYTACKGRSPSIECILQRVGLERLMLHNAGNDAVAQLAAGVKLALMKYRNRPEVEEEDEDDTEDEEDAHMDFKAGRFDILADLVESEPKQDPSTLPDYDYYHELPPPPEIFEPETCLLSQLSTHGKAQPAFPVVGSHVHCFKCGADDHVTKDCALRGFYECKRCLKRNGHIIKHCPYRGGQDGRLENIRYDNYSKNWEHDRKRGKMHQPYVPLAQTDLTDMDNIFESEESRAAVAALEAQLAFEKTIGDVRAFPTLTPGSTIAPKSSNPLAETNKPTSSTQPDYAARALSFWASRKTG